MRLTRPLIILAAVVTTTMLSAAPSGAAEPYKWCAQYGGQSGVINCGFVTRQQCMETIRGLGGFCDINPAYAWSTPPVRRGHKRSSGGR